MTARRQVVFTAVAGAALTACAPLAPATLPAQPAGAQRNASMVTVRDAPPGRYITFNGAKAQHAPPYLDTPGTNFYCLRSFLDRRTGETAHQLYVSDSYDGAERDWDAARDSAGRRLAFVTISRSEISCEAGCSYAEEFAADIPDRELRASPNGFAVTFTDRAGGEKTIKLSAGQIAAQFAAVEQRRSTALSPAAAAEPAPPP